MINKSVFSSKSGEVYDPFSYTTTFKDELSALKKINQFGKKLSTDGEYIMYNGMLFGRNKTDDGTANSISIAFIDSKQMNILSPMMLHPMLIKGIDFYQLTQNGNFTGYEEFLNRLELYFDKEETVSEEFDVEKFIKYAKEKGYTDFEVVVAYKKGWESNMAIYNLYLKYLQTLGTRTDMVRNVFKMEYVPIDHPIMKSVTKVMNELMEDGRVLCKKDISDAEFIEFTNSEVPSEYRLQNVDGGHSFIRVMKNVFITMSTQSNIGFQVLDTGREGYHYLETIVETSGTTVFNLFKILPM